MADQKRIYEIERRKIAALNAIFMEMVNHPTNPLTQQDLEALIARRPSQYARFSGFLDKLPRAA